MVDYVRLYFFKGRDVGVCQSVREKRGGACQVERQKWVSPPTHTLCVITHAKYRLRMRAVRQLVVYFFQGDFSDGFTPGLEYSLTYSIEYSNSKQLDSAALLLNVLETRVSV